MSPLKGLAIPCLLVLVSACVVEQPRERVVVEPPPARERVVVEQGQPEVVVVKTAPPVELVEEVPPPRPGYIWVRGHWRWNGSRHEWAKGHWEPERVGLRYVQPRWDHVGDEWHFTAGFWAHS